MGLQHASMCNCSLHYQGGYRAQPSRLRHGKPRGRLLPVSEGEDDQPAELLRLMEEVDRACRLAERLVALPGQSPERTAAMKRYLQRLRDGLERLARESLAMKQAGALSDD